MQLTVTVIDDDALMLEIVRFLLLDLGISSVATFSSAKSALGELNLDDASQVILCDLNMPDMDGVEFLRCLAQEGYAGGLIMFSGEDTRTLQMVKTLARAHRLRLLGAITKPLQKIVLANMLESMCLEPNNGHSALYKMGREELRTALKEGWVTPYYQPQVNAVSGSVPSVEALARIQHPDLGLLGPASFISVAEESGLIIDLTDVMLKKSMQQWSIWKSQGVDLCISVNVSMDCLSRIQFPDLLVEGAASVGMPLDQLVLEITESRVMQDTTHSLDVLSRLCLKRVKLSIDDFGTAYSNFEKLQMLPFYELKIDRSFVHNSMHNRSIFTFLESSVGLGKRLGMKIVAEGAETQSDWLCAASLGCDLIQGYIFAKPMNGDRLLVWLREWLEEKDGKF